MGDLVIRVEQLSKRYRIGHAGRRHDTIREMVMHALTGPLHRRRAPASEAEADALWALRDVSFDVAGGEVLGIIGRNGAGKSTLLKILARIIRPTAGRVRIRGRVAALLEVGTGFHRELTGRENVFLSGVILGMTRAEVAARLDEIVAFSGVERFIDTPVKHYSSGMYLRLAFAVGAHLRTEVLFVDEIIAVGDAEFQKRCLGAMERVAGEGRTVLLVSHNMSAIAALCRTALLLDGGMVRAHGPVEGVIHDYLRSHTVGGAMKELTPADHHPNDGGSIRVRRLTLLNAVANTFTVHWRQPISVALEIDALRDLPTVTFAVAVRALDGTWIFVSYAIDSGNAPWTMRAGRHRVEITVENPLRPGVYTLNFGAHGGDPRLTNLFAVDATTLEVLDFADNGAVADLANPGLVVGVAASFSTAPLVSGSPR